MDAVKLLDEKYHILREIKRGGFGVVYYGWDRMFDKPVAIKAISPDLLGKAKYIDIFQAESLSVARLNHHNVVRLYDVKRTDDGQFYIIMEYIDGIDLGRLLTACRKEGIGLPFEIGAYVIAQCCSGLDYAHARRDPDTHQPLNIVHQDISPANIMINRQGEIKIIDFGLASARRRSVAKHSRKGEREVLLQGKIAYLAPEQVNGHHSIDRRADIFSLGLVMYEALTGERLIKSDNPAEVVNLLTSGNWAPSGLSSKEVPGPLQLIVQRAIQKDPESRYQTANQMYLDLMTYLATQEAIADISNALGLLVQRFATVQKRAEEATPIEPSPDRSLSPRFEAGPEIGTPVNLTPEIEQIAETVELQTPPEIDFPIEGDGEEKADQSINQLNTTTEEGQLQENKTPNGNSEASPANTEVAIQEVPFYRILEEEEEQEDEQRTIIDVIRLSTRSHKKAILISLGSLLGAFLLFTLIDTTTRWTGYGAAIYDMLFPPAIRIVSFPPDAQVYLDEKLLPQTTPMAIDRISPGVHKLMLLLPRFEPIVRSIQVPPKGGVVVEGNDANPGNQPYVFRFKTTLQLSSKPSGAEVYLNGIKYTQITPCRVVWEVGDPLQIEMERPGFARLSGFTLNTVEGVENIEDRRLWRFQRIEPDREHFAIEGTFAKAIVLTSLPNNAEIYLDGSERPVGITGFTNRLLLTVGMHTVALQKRSYLSKTFTIRVDENTPDEFQEVLSRVVKVFAKDPADPGDNDIGATILQLTYDNNSTRISAKTPCELALLPFKYTALLRKDGYKDHTLVIPAAEQVVIARLERIEAPVELLVVDDAAGTPLENVEIICRSLRKSDNQEIIFNATDAAGVSAQELPPGEYRFVVRKEGYRLLTKDFVVTTSNRNRLVLKMVAL